MDMVISAGKSRKNNKAYVLLPPATRQAIDMLIDKRCAVGVPDTNVFVFGRLSADRAMAGHTEMKELAYMCGGLKYPEKISSRHSRSYIATLCQVSSYIHTSFQVYNALSLTRTLYTRTRTRTRTRTQQSRTRIRIRTCISRTRTRTRTWLSRTRTRTRTCLSRTRTRTMT